MQTAFIIGASSGIGYETAKMLKNSGFTVINGSRTPCDLPGIKNITLDVTDKSSLKEAFTKLFNEIRRLDVFIYSAGFSMAAPVEYAKEDDFSYLFSVNYFGALRCMEYVLPVMRAQNDGRIILISSVGGSIPVIYDSFYSSSKAALNMLAMGLRTELKPYNIKVYSVSPGGTATSFTFKRKVYTEEETGVYALRQKKAVSSLYNMEQGGMEPKDVALFICKSIDKENPPPILTPGFMNKTALFMAKILPKKLTLKLNAKKYRQK